MSVSQDAACVVMLNPLLNANFYVLYAGGPKISVPQIKEGIVKVPIKEEQSADVPVSQMRREIVKMIQLVLGERIKGRVADQMMAIPGPRVREEIVAIVQEEEKLVSQERVQYRTVGQIVDVPQILEETVDVVRLIPQEHEQCIDEQMCPCHKLWKRTLTWRVRGPTGTRAADQRTICGGQYMEEIVEEIKLVPQETCWRGCVNRSWTSRFRRRNLRK